MFTEQLNSQQQEAYRFSTSKHE